MPQNHPVFQEPKDRSVKIWRHIDLTKMLSLLEDRALFFARTDQFGDPFEGSFPRTNVRLRPLWYKDIVDKSVRVGENQMSFIGFQSYFHSWLCQWTFVSCWHINQFESAAMWRLYGFTGHGIALQSTYDRLRSCLPASVLTGEVQYLDYDSAVIPEGNYFWPFVHKRLSFAHEQELRALIQDLPIQNGSIALDKRNTEKGSLVPIDLETLVESLYIAPSAPTWYPELMRSVLRRYGLSKSVNQSSLDADPIY